MLISSNSSSGVQISQVDPANAQVILSGEDAFNAGSIPKGEPNHAGKYAQHKKYKDCRRSTSIAGESCTINWIKNCLNYRSKLILVEVQYTSTH